MIPLCTSSSSGIDRSGQKLSDNADEAEYDDQKNS